MARMTYDAAMAYSSTNSTNDGDNTRVRFFGLKDGEEAIVRIMCDNTAELDIHTVHNVVTPDAQYGRRMNCLRLPTDPIEMCPLCQANKPIKQMIYLKLIHYTRNESGQIVPVAKVWERNLNDRKFGARAIATYVNNYGPLSDIICKIIRRGSKLNTEYDFVPNLNPQAYPPNVYVKDTSLFGEFSPIGSMILNKTADEYNMFLTTGQFPVREKPANNNNEQVTPRTYNPTPNYQEPPVSVPPMNNQPAYSVPNQNTYANYGVDPNAHPVDSGAPQYNNAPPFDVGGQAPVNNAPRNPWDNPTPTTGFDRPRRY